MVRCSMAKININPYPKLFWSAASKVRSALGLSVADKLRSRFDVLVDMNAHHTAAKGTSMAIFGLCGCIGGYIDNPSDNTLFHYDPFVAPVITELVRQQVTCRTNQVHFFVSGEWQEGADGRDDLLVPKAEYSQDMLGVIVARIRAKGVECLFHCYDEKNRRFGNDYMARSQGTVWIDKTGKLFAEGMPVQNSRPKLATPVANPNRSQLS